MSINDRFQEIINILYKGNKRAFATSVCVSPTVIENVVGTRKGKPSYDVLEKVCANANISPVWLLMGEGNMLKNQTQTISPCSEAIPCLTESLTTSKPIPLVTQSAVAGFGNSDFAIHNEDIKELYVIPKFKHRNVDFMIEVSGASMYPRYTSGDIVACSILRESRFIQWNNCHVIATIEQGILLKRLLPGNDGEHLKAVSDNKDFPPFDIPVNEIKGIALVVGMVRLD